MLLVGSTALADTATPTPSASPSPAPAPFPTAVPAFTSKVTVTYTFHDIPIIIVTGHLNIAFANGDTMCNVLVVDRVYEALADGTLWPWDTRSDPPLCKQPGVSVRLCRAPTVCSEEFTYAGTDVSGVDFPVTLAADTPLAIAHFVHGGASQTVSVTGWLFESGGYACSSGGGRPPAVTSEVAHIWPTISQCSPPGQDVHVTFTTVELGDLHATFQWNSGDVNYEVDTGAFLQTPTPSPSPPATAQPAPTAAQLPRSGGAPHSQGLPLAKTGVAVAAISAGVAILRQSRSGTMRRKR